MAETTLLKEPLTAEMIDIGGRLTEALDGAGVATEASFWLFEEESNDWTLQIASPEYAVKGSFVLYETTRALIKDLGLSKSDDPLWNVRLIRSNDALVRALQAEFKEGPYIAPMRLGRGAIRGRFIDDAYIYRVN